MRQLLLTSAKPITAAEFAKHFFRGNADRIEDVLQSLVILRGQTREGRARGGKAWVDLEGYRRYVVGQREKFEATVNTELGMPAKGK